MAFPLHVNIQLSATVGMILMSLTVLFVRLRAGRKPVSVARIIMPSAGMTTGFLMFLFEPMRIPWSWAAVSFLCGAVILSIPLIMTSKFESTGSDIYLKKSRAFVWILLVLLLVRLALHSYIEQYISVEQTGAVFFILAYGMLLPWRAVMYLRFQKIRKQGTIQPR